MTNDDKTTTTALFTTTTALFGVNAGLGSDTWALVVLALLWLPVAVWTAVVWLPQRSH